ncbi:MAG: hypothetical protein ACP5QT_08555, partial [Brevinematia bacterium]
MRNNFQISRYTIGALINKIEGDYQHLLWSGMDSMAREKNINIFYFVGGSVGNLFEGDESNNLTYELAKSNNIEGLII